eukprot:comp17443_c0_seq1/m.16862 comp17443_c0_seq1/g.16862  ORF comp17443_c0_seq1/g.16862 comp17443_c0_seq1/m.16862 type:complete len:125 (-) comp17443_c0_seq1:910-1284(-)
MAEVHTVPCTYSSFASETAPRPSLYKQSVPLASIAENAAALSFLHLLYETLGERFHSADLDTILHEVNVLPTSGGSLLFRAEDAVRLAAKDRNEDPKTFVRSKIEGLDYVADVIFCALVQEAMD